MEITLYLGEKAYLRRSITCPFWCVCHQIEVIGSSPLHTYSRRNVYAMGWCAVCSAL